MQWVTEMKNFAPELMVYIHHGKTKIKGVLNACSADLSNCPKGRLSDVNDPNLAGVHVVVSASRHENEVRRRLKFAQITTYDQVMNEHGAFETVDKEKRSLSQTPLFTVHWKRVVLGALNNSELLLLSELPRTSVFRRSSHDTKPERQKIHGLLCPPENFRALCYRNTSPGSTWCSTVSRTVSQISSFRILSMTCIRFYISCVSMVWAIGIRSQR